MVVTPLAFVGGIIWEAAGLTRRKERRQAAKLNEWRENALNWPVYYRSENGVRKGWDQLRAVADARRIEIDETGFVGSGAEAWALAEEGWEGAAVTSSNSITLSPELDLPRKVSVLAHELAHLADPSSRAMPSTYADKEVVAELASHVYCFAYGIDTDEKSWRYIEGWIDRTKNARQPWGHDPEDLIRRATIALQRIMPPNHPMASRDSIASAYHKFMQTPDI